ncbi:MAG: hypothetical protein GFH27_549291n217 [Chloroflexi bacterium AL-W]|nr:hypothetical protein [Chloroflexi bacterium AL-N1]NOK67315.1 hypothetical protein [Chloroflexi bacterium AL-N10]NOK75191.1 hypothetical protein [Chloroflexi bacterium AL-N5]NOK81979.1 hypothetical protein [Chloroflexi bacterium AL-W]NOK89824.1 hypothetical protein [Chloroflexi bacterium AL-N15]
MDTLVIVNQLMLWIMVILLLLMVLKLARRSVQSHVTQTQVQRAEKRFADIIGQPAPDFSTYTLEGESITRSERFGGKPLVLVFMSTSCPHCRTAIPDLEITSFRARHTGIQIVPVISADLLETQQFVGDMSINIPVLVAPFAMSPWLEALNPEGFVPAYCYIGADGIIQSGGALHSQQWKDLTMEWQAMPVLRKPVSFYR